MPLPRLPLVTLYLTERCNSRCVTCDYWRNGRSGLDLNAVARLLPDFDRLGTEVALISGGEPLLNPQWAEIAGLLQRHGLAVWLLTSGLALGKCAQRASALFRLITVSLDGADRETYAAIRGVDAFRVVCRGIRTAAGMGVPVSVRVTLQRGNFRQLTELIDLAQGLGATQISFLAIDVASRTAFGRHPQEAPAEHLCRLVPDGEELTEFERLITALEHERAAAFESGFIAESPLKLRRILEYFRAVRGLGPYPPVHCNAPEFSAVIDARQRVHPCFFIQGPDPLEGFHGLAQALDSAGMSSLRAAIREGIRPECATCVCSMWRSARDTGTSGVLPPLRRSA